MPVPLFPGGSLSVTARACHLFSLLWAPRSSLCSSWHGTCCRPLHVLTPQRCWTPLTLRISPGLAGPKNRTQSHECGLQAVQQLGRCPSTPVQDTEVCAQACVALGSWKQCSVLLSFQRAWICSQPCKTHRAALPAGLTPQTEAHQCPGTGTPVSWMGSSAAAG